ncbi:uncharacterized protein RAG0_10983 [Rhynchosporium agropyri]|uniref:BRCT domain-containing protein n=1 Tax=Rhynchosporium agropyri TaxID=914238 RepID=A0A1E1L252_9HELO|nr:uncharacterized protein RAG0_10983 [Rhynchosporium agropyri]
MDQSPPKRVTRARAAAKTTDTGMKTTRIATAASKAKVTRNVATTKRKTRADDNEDEEQQDPEPIIEPELEPKTTRGRAKKAVAQDPEPEQEMNEPPHKPTRGSPKKVVAPVETPAPEPARATRGRAKKIEATEEAVVEEPTKRPTRARAPTVSKGVAPRKTVKFEEPDKENIMPVVINARGKAKAAEPATGLRAKPVRKPAATTATRATRGRAKNVVEEKPSPLSPKKATQVATSKETVSEDELATTEKTPMKALMKSPVKPAGSVFGTAKKLNFSSSDPITVNRVGTQDLAGSAIASPARRPPQSPFKETFKASAHKMTMGNSMLQSPFRPNLPAPKTTTENPSFKASLLQSPARRPQSPIKVGENGSPSRSANNASLFAGTPKASTFKISRFATPRTITKSAVRTGRMLPPNVLRDAGSPVSKDDSDATMMGAGSSLSFSGRLSSIMPRDADPSLEASEAVVEGTETKIAAITETPQVEEPIAPDTIVLEDPMDHNKTPPTSPPRDSTGFSAAFALREINNSPFNDSESEDELASDSPSYSPVPMPAFSCPLDFASSPETPIHFTALAKTPRAASSRKAFASARKSKIGFTPLAQQLNDWMAASPEKSYAGDSDEATSPTKLISRQDQDATPRPSPTKSSFFEDEMCVRDELAAEPEISDEEADLLDANFEVVELDDEDMALAFEADEMSLLESEELETYVNEDVAQATEELEEAEGEVTQAPIEEFLVLEPTILDTSTELEFVEQKVQVSEPALASEILQVQSKAPATYHDVELVSEGNTFETSLPEVVQEEEQASPMVDTAAPKDIQDSEIDELSGEVDVPYSPEPALSEASQEYGDENAMPIDPRLMSAPTPRTPAQAFATPKPKRVLGERICHTVSKVPLKAPAEDSAMRPSPKKRSASISRLPTQRPSSTLSRNNTVISYSPTKSTFETQSKKASAELVMQDAIATPSRDNAWSSIQTPARTPRRDINTALLKGAVVFVDVHTSEGSDASALFTELLTQMGARCVKTWSWNGSSEDTAKIGITHVVYKDGGKRTLERVKETNGVVSCVGVSWVLDCERENKWLDESSYSVDTGMVPRGGHRRRKSMEPRALAKLNGELISSMTPNRNASPSKEFLHFPDTPVTTKSRRRESVQWVRSPASSSSTDYDDQTLILSPVPATPAPETISAYGEDGLYGEDTPVGQTPYFLHNEQLVQKTAPAGRRFVDTEQVDGQNRVSMGAGFLSEKKDETVMSRLMAARRKSMQFAPKIGSPLARGSLF